jgi:hypothetical protein
MDLHDGMAMVMALAMFGRRVSFSIVCDDLGMALLDDLCNHFDERCFY